MSWRDFLIALLRVGSSLEHALMIQYLYAAYSLGGPQVPKGWRPTVRKWQETLLTIAREEMGHLLTVQNVITFLGADVDFARGEFAWDFKYFNLEPLTKGSLACYVFAEMEDQEFQERETIESLVKKHLKMDSISDTALVPVGDIYAAIILLLGDSKKIPDSVFRPESFASQASWDDWGRGYRPQPRLLDPEGSLIDDPAADKIDQARAIVLVNPVATRTQAVEALTQLAVQGEGPLFNTTSTEDSHFKRLMEIFQGFEQLEKKSGVNKWSPSLNLAINPTMIKRHDNDPTRKKPDQRKTYISCKQSRTWATLFNIRYRMLMASLVHTFRLARITRHNEPSLRAVMMHRVFGEMYNLKAIARMLVEMPMKDGPIEGQKRVGPPFEAPADHTFPPTEIDCWYMHLDNLTHVRDIARELLNAETHPQRRIYLKTLINVDTQTIARFNRVLTGLGYTERYFS
jgi:hypothetical protein